MRLWWFYTGQVKVPLDLAKEMKLPEAKNEPSTSPINKTPYVLVDCSS